MKKISIAILVGLLALSSKAAWVRLGWDSVPGISSYLVAYTNSLTGAVNIFQVDGTNEVKIPDIPVGVTNNFVVYGKYPNGNLMEPSDPLPVFLQSRVKNVRLLEAGDTNIINLRINITGD